MLLLEPKTRPPRGGADEDVDDDDEAHTRRREPIVCAACEAELSDRDAVFCMDDERASRVFLNPHGYLHEIVTVRWVRGVEMTGAATLEFTWFAGYAWRIALCAQCGAHVGWEFGGQGEVEPGVFWGLRRVAVKGV